MRIVFAYCVTSQPNILARLDAALSKQTQHLFETPSGWTVIPILLSSQAAATHSRSVTEYFGPNIFFVDPFRDVPGTSKPVFCLSVFRNVSINVAVAMDADWLILCDCDTLIVSLPTSFPASQYGRPKVYWQKSAEEDIAESLVAVKSGGEEVFSKGNSWFMMERSICSTIRFNENIRGYGWEDIEFNARVLASGRTLDQTDMIVIHLYHAAEERNIDPALMNRNKAVAEGTMAALSMGISWDQADLSDVMAAYHPHWQSQLILLHGSSIVLRHTDPVKGVFAIVGDKLIVTWESSITEQFRLLEDGAHFLTRC